MPNQSTTTDYQYGLYKDYLEQLDGIMVKYGQQSGLSIEYWHIKADLSQNSDDLKIQNANKHYVYDLYHFLPTINMTPLTYQIGYDQTKQGTSNTASGSFSMYLLEAPLPGDMFRFYPYDDTTQRTEIFRITNVRYMRTSKDKLSLYQVDFETAPMTVGTLEHVRINEIWCWDTERSVFNNEEKCSQMECIIACRDKLIVAINHWYDEQNGWYGLCRAGGCSGIGWDTLCKSGTGATSNPMDGLNNDSCPDGPNIPSWPPGPGWPGWNDTLLCPVDPNNPDSGGGKFCSGKSTTKPLVFLNTILKRLKRIFDSLDIKPIYGIGTAKIPIEWVLPTATIVDPNNPDPLAPGIEVPRDYWDTFTCLSYQPEATTGELFNVTQILAGECTNCPQELIAEIECNRELYVLVVALVKLLEPLMTEEQLQDNSCDRKCCDKFDPAFVGKCLSIASAGQYGFDNLFWDSQGSGAERTARSFFDTYNNSLNIPLYLTFRDGAVWPDGGIVQ
jgi:hypothetical protein